MLRFLGVLVILLALIAGIGYYRGWFRTTSEDTNSHGALTLTVDKDKIDQDKVSAEHQVQDLGHK
jgi:hypothetical protein